MQANLRRHGPDAAGPPTRVAVFEQAPVVREGLGRWFARRRDLVLCAEIATHQELEPALSRANADLLLLDPLFPGNDGVTLIRDLAKRHGKLRLLVFSHQDENLYAERLLRAGASGYLMKNAKCDELIGALRAVQMEGTYVSPRLSLILLGRLLHPTGRGAGDSRIASLTTREFHIFQLFGAGLHVREIGTRLGVSGKTVQAHRENIKNKLGLATAPELLRYAALWVSQHSGGHA